MTTPVRENTAPIRHRNAPAPPFFLPQDGNRDHFFAPAPTPAPASAPTSTPIIQRQPATTTSPDEWTIFAEEFNTHFRSILHVFNERGWPPDRHTAPGSQSGDSLDEAQLQALFTDNQRRLLMDFFSTGHIPDRLFNGDEVNHTTAQQRLLMAALILSTGTYRPGSFEQRVHARMCFHWVHIVHHYAGVTPASLGRGIMGSFDHAGNIVLPAGRAEGTFMGDRVFAEDLPVDESGGIGPIPADTGHEDAAESEESRRAVDPTEGRRVHRRHAFPFARFGELQPGDWLWYYNANSSGGGSHSVIFSRWAAPEDEVNGIHYHRAILFSQPRPERGGREHTANLGEQYYNAGGIAIYPVTYVTRVAETAHPARTVDELLPSGNARAEGRLSTANERFLARASRRFGRSVSRELLIEHLREENNDAITALSHRLTDGQRTLLQDANATTSLETLVRLTQRLRALRHNMEIYESNIESTYEGRLNERHAAALTAHELETARITGEMTEADRDLAAAATEIGRLNEVLSDRDLTPQLRDMRRELAQLRRQLGRMRRSDPDRATVREAVNNLRAALRLLERESRSRSREIGGLRSGIGVLERQSRRLRRLRERLERQLGESEASLPYGLVHPGALGRQDSSRMTGRIEDIFTIRQMEQFAP